MLLAVQLTLDGFEQTEEHNHRFFREEVATYSYLEGQATRFYSHIFPSEEWNVHFHLEWEDTNDDECGAPLQIVLWNSGAYFNDQWLDDDMLKVKAHFVPKEGDRSMELQVGLGKHQPEHTSPYLARIL
ncbi:uncharacterized protein K460DRAFT_400664 [Cucurbitaria berberidis CBS 394.84]|uniref:Uncharacterized protein n=1 Tax=Cucurbitaria berberidis CBS 394.84 TaxID=1168544 RepID=A0A9P4GT70_9PLEO|nr:uncharacterized protein K460DRAFT_400664 [Cucurbitaria berberidis CBS 394.84]KAF1850616.1 hypothetical protein K460DRAFT_400664 [Cucurbitaria berberidis CBS 394.84]